MTPDLPRVSAESLTGGAPIVVLAPHPDDESLGCGALLAHAFDNHGAHVICMTDGGGSHPGSTDWPAGRLAAMRWQELSHAIVRLGGMPTDMTWLGHPDGWLGLQDADRIVADIVAVCRDRGVQHLFAPAPEDHQEDHRTTACIAQRVALAMPDLTLFSYPVWSRWDDPDLLDHVAERHPVALESAAWRARKILAIAAHRTQRGLVVDDDPTGFRLPQAFIDAFATEPEIFWRAA
ncbi:PIG-L deacetylase family protein [Loktanella sp. M215]|uniref:PIG-L deacetylase family protein n=1 Tax=Loktanella sp. M215 TaxID=2675431 RepID=UPI001F42F60E|nr:PIG-L family deacetylase [Loktanella sp. M215]MCF7701720.1 PIG-L family deacetylase [Loktanella sp. M215]